MKVMIAGGVATAFRVYQRWSLQLPREDDRVLGRYTVKPQEAGSAERVSVRRVRRLAMPVDRHQ